MAILWSTPTNKISSTLAASYDQPLAEIAAILINNDPRTEAGDTAQIEVKRAADGKLEVGRVGMQLFANDEIKTGEGVEVSLVFTKPNSEDRVEVLVHEKAKARISSIFAYYGSFFLTGLGIFDTKTNYVRLGKRGTEFQVNVSEDGDVDVNVLRGTVDVEKGEFTPGGFDAVIDRHLSHKLGRPIDSSQTSGRATVSQTKTVNALQSLKAKRYEPLPEPRPLETQEVMKILEKTDKLLLASLGASPPPNIIPTSFTAASDPVVTKQNATEAFKTARRNATLEPSAKNITALGDVYKDLGAGKRASAEYNEALRIDPSLRNSVKFLAGKSEAYRLAGNLDKAGETIAEALRKANSAEPKSAQLALNAWGNVSYDKAIVSVGRNDWKSAGLYFTQSRNAFEDANRKQSGDASNWITDYNLKNVRLAFKSDPTISTFTALNGTYRGAIDFPWAGVGGQSVLVVTGDRFTILNCKETLSGSILARDETTEGPLFDFLFDTKRPVKKLTLKAIRIDAKRINLTSASTELNPFSFTSQTNQPGLGCLPTTYPR